MRLPPPAVLRPTRWAWIGVDIGLSGGIAVLHEDAPPRVLPVPLAKAGDAREPDVSGLVEVLRDISRSYRAAAAVEQPFIKGKQAGQLTIGRNWGLILAAFRVAGVPAFDVRPQEWQGPLLAGIIDPDPKVRAAEYVHRHFPEVCLRATKKSKNDHDGIIDALCIAAWVRAKTGAIT